MPKSDKEQGYNDAMSGKENSNPNDRGILSRSFDILVDVGSANIANTTQTNDQKSSDYDAGYKAGTENRDKK